jgi:hypothetical protein
MPGTSYERDIRPLFRQIDIDHMNNFGVDLSTYDGVKENAEEILSRLKDTTRPMPPVSDGGPWPLNQIDLFERWMQEGFPS